MAYWFNVESGRVETDDTRSRGEVVLGPYETEAQAWQALETAHRRTEEWDAEDQEWDEGTEL